jgi:hypothetical protein
VSEEGVLVEVIFTSLFLVLLHVCSCCGSCTWYIALDNVWYDNFEWAVEKKVAFYALRIF